MATLTTAFQEPTTYVPASFTLVISPAEAAQVLKEATPLAAGNITVGNFATAYPGLAALIAALQAGVGQTATAASPGATVPNSVATITIS